MSELHLPLFLSRTVVHGSFLTFENSIPGSIWFLWSKSATETRVISVLYILRTQYGRLPYRVNLTSCLVIAGMSTNVYQWVYVIALTSSLYVRMYELFSTRAYVCTYIDDLLVTSSSTFAKNISKTSWRSVRKTHQTWLTIKSLSSNQYLSNWHYDPIDTGVSTTRNDIYLASFYERKGFPFYLHWRT